MKKILISVSALLLCAALMASCSAKGNGDAKDETKTSVTTERKGFEDVTAPPEDTDDIAAHIPISSGDHSNDDGTAAAFSTEDAVAAARAWYGDADGETGFKYSYSFDEMVKVTDTGKEYYKIRVSWYLEEEDRYSLCCYLLVSEDGSVSYYNW